MPLESFVSQLTSHWESLYGDQGKEFLKELIDHADYTKHHTFKGFQADAQWYKDAVVYCTYVDLFAGDFTGMTSKLPYLKELGVNALWLLPILDSPMRDQGFDIQNYYHVRADLGGNEAFFHFIKEAHISGIKIFFDVPLNHCSDAHEWFQQARLSKDNPYRDYFIWNDTIEKYEEARLIFKGMVPSNWEYNEATDDYFFHRFYEFQPDLNYHNPKVLLEVINVLLYWKEHGIDGFRMDAIPFLWKEEGTTCENLPQTHTILKIFRCVLDYVQKGTLMIAEANLEPKQVVDYFGDNDECQAAYHFPLMPQFYMAIAEGDHTYVTNVLDHAVTPKKPDDCMWLSFLRCHDELTLEFVPEHTREVMNQHYLKHPDLSFREGEGIAGRLFDMFDGDVSRILCMYSMLMSTKGAPLLYYGDEIGLRNDREFYEKNLDLVGHADARFFNRGPMHWEVFDSLQPDDPGMQIFQGLAGLIKIRKDLKEFFHRDADFHTEQQKGVLHITRYSNWGRLHVVHNLTNQPQKITLTNQGVSILTHDPVEGEITLLPYCYSWVLD